MGTTALLSTEYPLPAASAGRLPMPGPRVGISSGNAPSSSLEARSSRSRTGAGSGSFGASMRHSGILRIRSYSFNRSKRRLIIAD